MTELRLWAAVFQEEFFEMNPQERHKDRVKNGLTNSQCDAEIKKMKRIMKPSGKRNPN